MERGLTAALEHVAEQNPVTWFGANSRHLRLSGRIDHRDAVDYFSLPGIYSRWLVVVDDVIDSAARYGNQNSRLFDALACGAMVVTNTGNGLAELGLDEVPVYRDPEDLARIVGELVADPAATRARAARLRDVVVAQHSAVARAELVRPLLETALAESVHPGRRSSLIRWVTLEREKRRELEVERDEWRTRYFDVVDDYGRVRAELDDIRSSSSYRITRRVIVPVFGLARRLVGRR
ncbi:hypothetical protein GCM10025881_10710 [Pseudolysinimonas kribbensis]|uniref:Spore protein YkvP/CgeB glycosyl transferase-like domain-containing protein n=1 Tax=Pseudolysinimonas kribbensis TaxID=433641 RepID=A0ABQ6K5X6_9MICO|nr:glycosyltransferase [Pseudolysinimonas kribbensis]GMA94247.1 hypothetical protein GCM10025881_10710 [Pseudolysinimonas kribbensis]